MLNSIAMIHNGAICVLLSHNVVNEGVCMYACLMWVKRPFARHPWINGSIHTADGGTMARDAPAVKTFVNR